MKCCTLNEKRLRLAVTESGRFFLPLLSGLGSVTQMLITFSDFCSALECLLLFVVIAQIYRTDVWDDNLRSVIKTTSQQWKNIRTSLHHNQTGLQFGVPNDLHHKQILVKTWNKVRSSSSPNNGKKNFFSKDMRLWHSRKKWTNLSDWSQQNQATICAQLQLTYLPIKHHLSQLFMRNQNDWGDKHLAEKNAKKFRGAELWLCRSRLKVIGA